VKAYPEEAHGLVC